MRCPFASAAPADPAIAAARPLGEELKRGAKIFDSSGINHLLGISDR
jgi:hypothetical protein